MILKSIVREFREMRDGIGSKSLEKACWRCRASSVIAPDEPTTQSESLIQQQGRWADLPSELLLDIIQRVEESETSWPARTALVFCGSVCKSWREVTKEIVKTPEQCGRLTFPISLKQPGPREAPIQCYIRRDRASATYFLYYGLVPSERDNDKLLLAAKRIRKATCTEFVISLVSNDFSRASNTYVGKLRSNFLGTKFNIFDTQPPCGASPIQQTSRTHKFHSKQVSSRIPACNYNIGSISYELNVLRSKGPRRMSCVMDSIPFSSIEEGGTAPTPTNLPHFLDQSISPPCEITKGKDFVTSSSFPSPVQPAGAVEPLVLKNKAPRWHEQLQCWCLNFKGRVTVASVKNFQLAAAVEPFHNIGESEHDRTILQFGKIGKDIFTMDYRYPLSAFQAFAVCLSSFDTKPVCE